MATELDRLSVIFTSSGAAEVIASITKIDKSLEAFTVKFSKAQNTLFNGLTKSLNAIGALSTKNLDDILKKSEKNSESILKLYDKEIEKLKEIKTARESAYSDTRGGSTSSGITRGGGFNTLAALAIGLGGFRTVEKADAYLQEQRMRLFRRENQELLSGIGQAKAAGYDVALSRYGGERGEGLESLAGFSARLGAATRGDVSMLQSLGKWGVGGVTPYSSPLDVAKLVAQRAQSLSPNEQNAMFAEMGFTIAQRSAALKGDWGMFEKESTPTSPMETLRKASEVFSESVQETTAALKDLANGAASTTEWYDKLKSEYPKFYNFLSTVSDIAPSVLAFLNSLALFKIIGTGATAATTASTTSEIGAAAASLGALPIVGVGATVLPLLKHEKEAGAIREEILTGRPLTSIGDTTLDVDKRGWAERNWMNVRGWWNGLPFRWGELTNFGTETNAALKNMSSSMITPIGMNAMGGTNSSSTVTNNYTVNVTAQDVAEARNLPSLIETQIALGNP